MGSAAICHKPWSQLVPAPLVCTVRPLIFLLTLAADSAVETGVSPRLELLAELAGA